MDDIFGSTKRRAVEDIKSTFLTEENPECPRACRDGDGEGAQQASCDSRANRGDFYLQTAAQACYRGAEKAAPELSPAWIGVSKANRHPGAEGPSASRQPARTSRQVSER